MLIYVGDFTNGPTWGIWPWHLSKVKCFPWHGKVKLLIPIGQIFHGIYHDQLSLTRMLTSLSITFEMHILSL
jgi:hypothetical protein